MRRTTALLTLVLPAALALDGCGTDARTATPEGTSPRRPRPSTSPQVTLDRDPSTAQ